MELADFLAKYIRQTLAYPTRHVVTKDEYNNILNLLITQGDYNSEAMQEVVDNLIATLTALALTVSSSNIKGIRLNQDNRLETTVNGTDWVLLGSADTQTLVLGETSTTAYRGDRGKTAYDHSQAVGNTHGAAANQISIGDTGGKFTASDIKAALIELYDNKVGTAAEGTTYCGIDTNNVGKINPVRSSAAIVEITADTTLSLAHAGVLLEVNSSTAKTITIPTNATVAFPIGTEIEIQRYGTGSVTIAAGSTTIVCPDTARTIYSQYSSVCLKKVATDTWLLQGAIG